MINISQTNGLEAESGLADVFSALGDNTRLVIISKLLNAPDQSVSGLSQGFPLTRQGVSRHLRVLENAGLVRSQHIGRETRYRLEADALSRARQYLLRASRQWDDAISRLARALPDNS